MLCFSIVCGLISADQAGLSASPPWEVSKPSSSSFVRKWVQSKPFWSQSNDVLESFERISWIVSWKWDLRLDHSAQRPDLLSESLEWFCIYADVKRRRINPFFPTLAHNEEPPAQFTVLLVLFPPISSLLHILQILMLCMKKQILPDGSCRCHLICDDDGPVAVGETEWKRKAVAKLLLFVGCLHLPVSVYYPRWQSHWFFLMYSGTNKGILQYYYSNFKSIHSVNAVVLQKSIIDIT